MTQLQANSAAKWRASLPAAMQGPPAAARPRPPVATLPTCNVGEANAPLEGRRPAWRAGQGEGKLGRGRGPRETPPGALGLWRTACPHACPLQDTPAWGRFPTHPPKVNGFWPSGVVPELTQLLAQAGRLRGGHGCRCSMTPLLAAARRRRASGRRCWDSRRCCALIGAYESWGRGSGRRE